MRTMLSVLAAAALFLAGTGTSSATCPYGGHLSVEIVTPASVVSRCSTITATIHKTESCDTFSDYTYQWSVDHGSIEVPSTGSSATIHLDATQCYYTVRVDVTATCSHGSPVEASASKNFTASGITGIAPNPPLDRPFANGDPVNTGNFTVATVPPGLAVNLTPAHLSCGMNTVTATTTDGCSSSCEVWVCCECSGFGSACPALAGLSLGLHSLHMRVGVGHTQFGAQAPPMLLSSELMTPLLSTRSALEYATEDPAIEVIRDNDGLRQVLTADGFADLVTENAYRYEIRFYRANQAGTKENGLYVPVSGADPFKTIRIENPDASATVYDHLQITETSGGSSTVSEFSYTTESGWRLSKGGGLRVESKTEGTVEGGGRYETATVMNASSTVVRQTQTVYENLAYGERATQTIEDPSGAALTTLRSYYESGDAQLLGLPASVENPDGSWQKYTAYDAGRVAETLASWGDVALDDADSDNCRRTESSYAPVDQNDDGTYRPASPRTVSEYVAGDLVRRTWHAYSLNASTQVVTEIAEQAATASADYGDTGNLRTVSTRYGAGADAYLVGKPLSVQRPDGTFDSYVYQAGTFSLDTNSPSDSTFTEDSGNDLRTTCVHGTAESPEGVANKTTMEVTVTDTTGAPVMREESVWNGTTYERIRWSVTENDALGHPLTAWKSDGTVATQEWGSCCGKTAETLADGTAYSYFYDDLKRLTARVKTGTSTQADITTSYTYDAEGRQLSETTSAGDLSLTTSTEYDVAGRVVATTDAAGFVTSYSYSDGGRVTTVTRPGGATEITENYLDGRVKSMTGTGVVARYYEYGATSGGLQWTMVYTGADNSAMWEKTTVDFLGRTFRTEKPNYDGNTLARENSYDSTTGRVVKTRSYVVETSTNVVAPTLYEYDALGSVTRSGLDINGNDALNLASADRINDHDTVYEEVSGVWWRKTTQSTYATASSGTATVTGIRKERLTGLGGSPLVVQEMRDTDINGNETVTTVTVNASTKTVTRTVDVPDSDTDEQTVMVNGLVQSSRSRENLTTTYAYDALGRRTEVTDPRTGTATTHYNGLGQIDWVEDAAGNTTTFAYDEDTGLRTAVTDPLNNTVYTAYNLHGQVWRTWGGGAYPLEYLYDDTYGRLQYLETFRGGTGWSGSTWPTDTTGDPDVTTWTYDTDTGTGLLTAKTYADSKGTAYTYDSAGRLATRTWARQVSSQHPVTTYSYDPNTGELTGIDYSDATPDVTFTYTRTGQKDTVTDAAGTRTFAYTTTLGEDSESIDGSLYTKLITRKYDSLRRSGGFQIGTSGTPDANYDVTYSYDSVGRFGELDTAVPSSFSATYGYVTNSNLVATVTFPNSIVTTRHYEDHRDLLDWIENTVGSTSVSKYDYGPYNDAAGRRTGADWSGSAFSLNPGQGNDSIAYGYNSRSEVTTAIATTRTAYDFAYSYDNIGNRATYAVQGQTPATAYVPNSVNQYTGTTNPTEAFEYDDDGNLTQDGDFEYTWDAENRLIKVEAATVVKVEFTYDYMSRRVRKVSYDWEGGAWAQQTDQKFVYDGWNPVLELASGGGLPSSTVRTWGLDLSQTLQGAGGVGGLLATHLSGQVNAFVYDGNGNVSEALRVSNGTIEAHYEYDPFGGTTASSGTWADANPYRFSTKYLDAETSLYYYGLRYYSPRLGRWTNRDPIEEAGGSNLFAFVQNTPLDAVDLLGLISGPNEIIALDKSYSPSATETYTHSTLACWRVSGHLAIKGSASGSSIQVYPTGESSAWDDSIIEVNEGSEALHVTVRRPKSISRPSSLSPTLTSVVGVAMLWDLRFRWTVIDQLGHPLGGVGISETVTVLAKLNTLNMGIITGPGITNSAGESSDHYRALFKKPGYLTGFVTIQQDFQIGNWVATVMTNELGYGALSGGNKGYFY